MPRMRPLIRDHYADADERLIFNLAGWALTSKLSMEEAAEKMGMSKPTLYKRLSNPSSMSIKEFRHLCRLSKASSEEILRMIGGIT